MTLEGGSGSAILLSNQKYTYLETVRHWLLLRPRGDTDEWVFWALQKENTRNASKPLCTTCQNSTEELTGHQAPKERDAPLPSFLTATSTGTHLSLGCKISCEDKQAHCFQKVGHQFSEFKTVKSKPRSPQVGLG